MKVAINGCFGGFSLSPLAVKRMAELQGRECYFFVYQRSPLDITKLVPATVEEASGDFMFMAFDIPDANFVCASPANWSDLSLEEKIAYSNRYEKHEIYNRSCERNDPFLIQVVEELGEKASGKCSKLEIVEIPDDVEWEIEEYDGNEHVAEKHRTWR